MYLILLHSFWFATPFDGKRQGGNSETMVIITCERKISNSGKTGLLWKTGSFSCGGNIFFVIIKFMDFRQPFTLKNNTI